MIRRDLGFGFRCGKRPRQAGCWRATLQDTVSGYLLGAGKTMIDGKASYDFSVAIYFWIGSAMVATILPLFVWNAKPRV